MPLPTNQSLSLLGYSRPGDAVQSKPKTAMFVRMSSETLDALESHPTQNQIQFEFGDSPGIYIGDTYFPMDYSQENALHELYLRASSATKKTAPLKLFANVVGKFAVSRELTNELRQKIQESTQDAVKERNNRTTVFIETPPDIPNPKKRKEPPASSSMFRKPLRPSDRVKPPPAASTPIPVKVPPPPAASSSASREGGVPLRKRVVQCLAAGEKSEDQLVKLVGRSNAAQSLRREVQALLEQIAEPTSKALSSDKSPRIYRLKPQSWKEVRPYEWPMMNEAERTAMARAARVAFQNLGIPESDPVWNHVRYRSPGSVNPAISQHALSSDQSRSSTSAAFDDGARAKKPDVPPKRGVSSRDTKEKNKRPKPDPKAEIMMKDESIRPARPNPPEVYVRNEPIRVNPPPERGNEPTRMNPPEVRRNDPVQNRRPNDSPRNNESTGRKPPLPEPKPAKTNGQQAPPEEAYASSSKRPVRVGDREPTGSGPRSRISSINPTDDKNLAAQRVKKMRRENPAGGGSDSERERDKVSSNVERNKLKEKAARREDSPRDGLRASATKRKVPDNGDGDFLDPKTRSMPQKRRKTEPISTSSSSSSSNRERDRDREREREDRAKEREDRMKDGSPLKRSYVEPSRPTESTIPRNPPAPLPSSSKSKPARKEDSPLPIKRKISASAAPAVSPGSPSSHSLQSNNHSAKSNSSIKARRRSPIYTSSEDEGEEDPLSTTRNTGKNGSSAAANNVASSSSSSSHTSRETSSRKLPTDHAALRARYNTSYLEYLSSFQRLVMQKGKLDSMLKNNDLASVGSITDSEGDIELMDADELAQLASNHRKLRDELMSIQQVFERTTKTGEPLPAPDMVTV